MAAGKKDLEREAPVPQWHFSRDQASQVNTLVLLQLIMRVTDSGQ